MIEADYIVEKLDSMKVPNYRKRRTCWRCGQINWCEKMRKAGSKWFCVDPPCYNPPQKGKQGGDSA